MDKYDATYWKDRYEHSQYQLPLSKRIIGDDGLYAYAGYKVIHGDNPFSINVDKPPVGKYLFGLSILLFNNPMHIVFLLGTATLVFFYILSRKMLEERSSTVFVVTLFSLEPFFFTQLWKSWYDVLQLFFLIINIVALFFIGGSRKISFVLAFICGIALVFSSQIKPALLFPIIFLLETLYFFSKRLRKQYLIFLIAICIGFFISYFRYMQLGNGILDVLKVQKYMASFYLESGLKVHPEAIWQTIFLGHFPEVTTRTPINVSEWWFLLPVVVLLAISGSIFLLFKKESPIIWKGFSIFVLTSLIIFSTIPSYPRYIVILLPFIYLLSARILELFMPMSLRMAIFTIVLIYGIVHSILLLLPSPNSLLSTFYYSLSHQYFHDIYQENLAKENQQDMTREEFRIISQKALQDATVKAIEVRELERNIPRFGGMGMVKIAMTYKTQALGLFTEEKSIKIVRENDQWKILWDWDIILSEYLPTYSMHTTISNGKRGSIIHPTYGPVVYDTEGYLVSVNPEKMDTKKEQEMIKLIGKLGSVNYNDIQNEYLENVLPGTYVPVATIYVPITDAEKNKLLSYPGLKLIAHPTRIYEKFIKQDSIKDTFFGGCCTRIYSAYNFHGKYGVEKEQDDVLTGHDGGRIFMQNQDGEIVRVVHEKTAKNGKDVSLDPKTL